MKIKIKVCYLIKLLNHASNTRKLIYNLLKHSLIFCQNE